MHPLQHLLDRNRRWSVNTRTADPTFFQKLAAQQEPDYLWIGCADSRVPANEIVDLLPGELFVHRNVANLVVHSDLNCLSVLQYAVDVLKVEHIIVCGHYGCGGVRAAMRNDRYGLVDNWLRHVQDLHRAHAADLAAIGDPLARENRLCELNVISQVGNVCATTIVQDAWLRGQPLSVYGWIYHLDDGLVNDLGLVIRCLDDREAIDRAKEPPR